jgi:organic radical activating enzyme
LIKQLKEGHHLIITGGSPLKQQNNLIILIKEFIKRHKFTPFIEIENECVIDPLPELIDLISLWNNSPKLSNTNNPDLLRYRPSTIKKMAGIKNSWFKFVICDQQDFDEIKRDYIDRGLINKNQIVLMPEGETKAEIELKRDLVIDIALKNNIRYTTREHVVVWDKTTSV